MINVSSEFKALMQERTDFTAYAVITFTDNSTLTLDKNDFTVANNSYTDSAGASAFPLGEAICKTIQVEIMNDEEQYSDYDFFGAEIEFYLDFQLSASTERVHIGKFTVLQPATYGDTIIITANDDMWRADKPFSPTIEIEGEERTITYPITIQNLYKHVCDACGFSYFDYTSTHFADILNETVIAPIPNTYTFRQVAGFIAMLAGGNALIDRFGDLAIVTYKFADSTHTADHDLTEWGSLEADMNDLTITGVQTTVEAEEDEESEDEETILYGTEGYVLDLENSLFAGQEESLLELIGDEIIGKSFRRFSGTCISNPTIEFMDTVKITDRKGNVFYSVVTDMNFVFGSFTELSNSAEEALTNGSDYASPVKQTLIKAKQLVARERTTRETAIEELNGRLNSQSGMLYKTVDSQTGVIYLHDKPELQDSQSIMKITSNAVGFSTDGGQHYIYGFTIDGNFIANILYAIGIDAEWLRVGTLGDYITIENGVITLNGSENTTATLGASQLEVAQARVENIQIGEYALLNQVSNHHLSLKWIGQEVDENGV